MEVVKPTFGRVLLLWWSIIWRCTVFGLVGAVLVSVVLGVALGLIGASRETMAMVGEVVGVGLGVAVCVYVGWSRIGKGIGDYELVMVKKGSGAAPIDA